VNHQIALIVDSQTTVALMTGRNKLGGVSVDLSLNCLEPIDSNIHSEIILESEVEQEGRSLSFISCKIKSSDENILFATGYHTKFMHPLSRGLFKELI
jgi:acyl-coenzyme A thioesterase PaaI-like protein